ncbi:MAG: glycosyltransferase family 4 protein [Chloroflexota bacterium]
MDLAVNGLRLTGKRFGVGRYVEYLLRHWGTAERLPFDRIKVYTPHKIEPTAEIPEGFEPHVIPAPGPNGLWEQVFLPWHHHPGDLLFCPSYTVPLAARGKIVVTHLGSYEAVPHEFAWRDRLKTRILYQLSARKAHRVITVSDSSKHDIQRYYGIPEAKVRVIPLGVDPAFRPLNRDDLNDAVRLRFFGTPQPYILFVGKLSRRRNIPDLIRAFGMLRSENGTTHGLLLVGENTVGYDLNALARASGVEGLVQHVPFATHTELVGIYNAAELFVYPSSYEGFGIPVLEAMACGVPTITLNNTAFREFAKDAAILADNGSAEAMYPAMAKVLQSQEIRHEMSARGLRRAERFGWAGIAQRTMDVLAEVAGVS